MKKREHVSNRSSKMQSHVFFILLIEIIIGILFTLVCLLILLKLRNEILEKELVGFDYSILRYLYSLRTPFLNSFMKSITSLGSQGIVLGGAVIWLYLVIK